MELPEGRHAEPSYENATVVDWASQSAPRLSILHLMLWTLCSAVLLTITRTLFVEVGTPDEQLSARRWINVISGANSGAVFAAAIVLLNSRFRHAYPSRLHPGHWLILVEAAGIAMNYAVRVLLVQTDYFGYSSQAMLLVVAVNLLTAIACALAASQSETLRWRISFAAITMLFLLEGLSYPVGLLRDLIPWLAISIPAWVAAVSIWDLRRHKGRDWLHWAGVTTYVANVFPWVIWMFFQRLFPQ